jgi:hypothetical protein
MTTMFLPIAVSQAKNASVVRWTRYYLNGIRMEIWEPNLIVLPIPENKLDANTPVQINVFITNNMPTPFERAATIWLG